MNVDEIFNTPRKKVDIENIQLPENLENDNKENGEKTTENGEQKAENGEMTMSCAQLAAMAIGLYDAIQTAVYKRIEPAFDAKLTTEETNALIPPTTAVLEQYNVTVSPLTALVVTIVGINVGKIMQIKMLQAEKAKQIEEAKVEEEEIKKAFNEAIEEAIEEAKAKAEKEKKGVQVSEQPTAGSITTTAPAPEKKETKKTSKNGK